MTIATPADVEDRGPHATSDVKAAGAAAARPRAIPPLPEPREIKAPATRGASIRRALLIRLALPLLALAAAGSLSTYVLAQYFSQRVLDQWLYDSANSLAKQVRSVDGMARLDLPRPALDILEWDLVDRFFYEVDSTRQGPMLANARLPNPKLMPPADGSPVFFDARVANDNVRAVAIMLDLPNDERLTIKVAETRHKRNAQTAQVLSATVVVSILLVLGSASLVWIAVGSGMSSLETAIRRIRLQHSKTSTKLQPLTDEPVPLEVQPLVDEIHMLVEELSAAHRSNQRFVGNTAHQLRTPLAAMRVQLESARREHDVSGYGRAVDKTVPELARLSHLLHQLLTLARVDEAHEELLSGLAPIDLDALARHEVERHIDEAIDRGLDIGYEAPGGPVMVAGKDALLREVVSNLLDNALRYGGPRGGQVTVGLLVDPVELYVEDQGPGIAEVDLVRVTERYYRVPGSNTEGSGLGLAIVDEIAQRHGARFVLEPGAGGVGLKARFVFKA